MKKYKVSKKMVKLFNEGYILRVTANALIEQAQKLYKQSIERDRKAWNLFWKENPDADKDVAYTYKVISQSIVPSRKEPND